jgi:hypothetical protein
METEAGYLMTWHRVIARQSDGTMAETKAIVFDWPYDTADLTPVPDGDWHKATPADWPMEDGR